MSQETRPSEHRDPKKIPKNQLFTFTQNQTYEKIVETSKVSTPSNNNAANLPHSVKRDETQMSYLMNNFALNSEKDINVKVEQNVNNITINIDGDDNPERIFKLIKENFPDGNRIKINYNNDGKLVEYNSGANDTTNSEKKNSSIEDDKRRFINISRLGPGRYSLEYSDDDVDNINNFANLLDLSKDHAKKNEKMKKTAAKSSKTKLTNEQNKSETMLKSEVDTIAGGPAGIETIEEIPKEPELSIDRHIDVLRKSSTKVIKKSDDNVKKHGTSVDKKPFKPVSMVEKQPSLKEKLDIV